MRILSRTWTILLFVVALCSTMRAQTTAPTTTPAARKRVLYTPPPRGAPDTRWGGGSRGAGSGDAPALAVLLPQTTAYTTSAHPTLFWFVSGAPIKPCEMSITDPDSMETIVRMPLAVSQPGIQRVDLGAQKVNFKTGVVYRWAVAIIADKSDRSKNTTAGGFVMRVEPPAGLEQRLQDTRDPIERAAAYAEQGLWCDALTELSDAIAAKPNDEALRAQRVELLKQAALTEAAAADDTGRAGP